MASWNASSNGERRTKFIAVRSSASRRLGVTLHSFFKGTDPTYSANSKGIFDGRFVAAALGMAPGNFVGEAYPDEFRCRWTAPLGRARRPHRRFPRRIRTGSVANGSDSKMRNCVNSSGRYGQCGHLGVDCWRSAGAVWHGHPGASPARGIAARDCHRGVHFLRSRSEKTRLSELGFIWKRFGAVPTEGGRTESDPHIRKDGGAEGIRTPDPHNAIVVLYQLSYDPDQTV